MKYDENSTIFAKLKWWNDYKLKKFCQIGFEGWKHTRHTPVGFDLWYSFGLKFQCLCQRAWVSRKSISCAPQRPKPDSTAWRCTSCPTHQHMFNSDSQWSHRIFENPGIDNSKGSECSLMSWIRCLDFIHFTRFDIWPGWRALRNAWQKFGGSHRSHTLASRNAQSSKWLFFVLRSHCGSPVPISPSMKSWTSHVKTDGLFPVPVHDFAMMVCNAALRDPQRTSAVSSFSTFLTCPGNSTCNVLYLVWVRYCSLGTYV